MADPIADASDGSTARVQVQVRVQSEDFDLGAEVAALRAGDAGIGAVATFTGTVRGEGGHADPLSALEIEHYPGMTERAMAAMADAACRRFGARAACVVHRVGRLGVGDQIVLVAVAAAHRQAALDACAFLMDWLKTDAPFWKKEITASGARWVEPRASDDAALARWGLESGNAGNGPPGGR